MSLFSTTPEELDGAARTIESATTRLRGVQAALERQREFVGGGAWEGPIATMGVLATSAHILQLTAFANALDEVASNLRRDAHRSRDELAMLRSIEMRVRNVPVPLPSVRLPPSGDPQWRAVEVAYRSAGLL